MTSLEAWKIIRDRSRCEKPGCPLPAATEWYAVLELPDCVRRDLCETCFQQRTAAQEARTIFWKARRKPGAKKEPTLDLQSLRALFDRLGEIADDADEEAARLPADGGGDEEALPAAVGSATEADAESDAAGSGAGESAAADPDAGDSDDPRLRADRARELRYFVALLLLRKRMLRMVDPKTPEQERADLVVIDPKADDPQPVALFAPELDTERLGGLKDELLAALDE